MRPSYVISAVKVTEKQSMIPYPKSKGAFSTAMIWESLRTF